MTTPGTVTWLRELAEKNGWTVDSARSVDGDCRARCEIGRAFDSDCVLFLVRDRASEGIALRALARLVKGTREAG